MTFITQKTTIPVKNESMQGTLYFPDSKETKFPAVVIFHGRGSSQARYTDRAEELAKAGFITLVFSFRGCDNSDGEFSNQTTKMGYEDALAGYDFLLNQKNVDENRIGVWGGSFGGYQATMLIKDRIINSLILAAPALYENECWDDVPELSRRLRKKYRNSNDFGDNKAFKIIQEYKNPLLIIQHEFDEICPRKQTDAFYESATNSSKKEKVIIKGIGHKLEGEKQRTESNKVTVDWFKETL